MFINKIKKKGGMVRVKKLASLFLLLFGLVLLSVVVFGQSISWTTPSAGTTLTTATNNLSCTVAGGIADNGTLHVEFSWQNQSETYIPIGTEATENSTVYEVNFDTTTFVDTATATANCTAYYVFSGVNATTSATRDFNLDNNAPTGVGIEVSPSRVEILTATGTTAICSGSDTNAQTYKVSLKDRNGDFVVTNKSLTDGDSSDRTRLRNSDFKSFGTHNAFCTLCDTANFCTDSSDVTITVVSKDGFEEEQIALEEEEDEEEARRGFGTSTIVIVVLGVLVVLIVAITLLTKKKK